MRTSSVCFLFLTVSFASCMAFAEDPDDLATLCQKFEEYSGARLVFHRSDLPPGRYHDVLKPLDDARMPKAAEICLEEVHKLPRGYFRDVGLKAIGVFAACASKTGDGYRPYDKQLGGYRYFGTYNGKNAVAAAYYSDGQLELTFQHEIFHHVDSTQDGKTERWLLSSDDALYQAALAGKKPYAAPEICAEDLDALRTKCIGMTLQDAVSAYAAKNSREDQAETARHLMSVLPDALVQVVEQPELPGSQRILHVLKEYERSSINGPGIDWFVDAALQRTPTTLDEIVSRLRGYASDGGNGFSGVEGDPGGARATLNALARFQSGEIPPREATELVRLSAVTTQALLKYRIRPDLNFCDLGTRRQQRRELDASLRRAAVWPRCDSTKEDCDAGSGTVGRVDEDSAKELATDRALLWLHRFWLGGDAGNSKSIRVCAGRCIGRIAGNANDAGQRPAQGQAQ